ncbi:MAG TPA: DUF58 domain-containing protein [Angustibacter sp.]|nr:DUF58 domain-containing protein [Angustibacter sp.]
MVVTGRAALLAALGVLWVGFVQPGWDGVLVWLAVVGLAVVADVVLAASPRALAVTRETSASVRLGEPTSSLLTLTNRGRRRLRGRVRDAWPPSAGAVDDRHALVLAGGDRRRVVTSLRPTRRGDRVADRVTVRSLGPLGVAGRQRALDVPGRLRVLPPFTSRRHLPSRLARLREIDGRSATNIRGQGTEFDSLRDYVEGDDVRSIDWRATARRRQVVVRTWRPERDRRIVLAVDTGRSSAARIGDEPRLDAALDAALLVAAVAARAGDRVGLVAADVAVRARLGTTGGAQLLPALVDALAALEPALVETDPQLLAGEVLRQVGQRSLVVLFGSLDTGTDTGLLPAVRSLVARHEVIVAAVSDPTLGRWRAQRSSADDVYVAAAAELAAADRDRVAEGLRRMGAHVVDAPADVFASHVADAYLELKAAGRL